MNNNLSKEEQDNLVLEHQYLIYSFAKKFKYEDKEDIVQEGNIGLILASRKYNPDRGIQFNTYAYYYVRKYIYKYITSLARDTVIPSDMVEQNEEECPDDSPEIRAILKDLQNKFYDILLKAGVKERSLDIALSTFLNESPISTKFLAKKYGISRQRVQQIKQQMEHYVQNWTTILTSNKEI